MKRQVEVEISGVITMEIDDEAVSDWDGKKLLEIHAREGGAFGQREMLAAMAYSVGVLNSHDGFADFPDEAIRAWDFVGGPEFGRVTLDGKDIQ